MCLPCPISRQQSQRFFCFWNEYFANQDVIKSLLCSKAKDITLFPQLAHLLSYLWCWNTKKYQMQKPDMKQFYFQGSAAVLCWTSVSSPRNNLCHLCWEVKNCLRKSPNPHQGSLKKLEWVNYVLLDDIFRRPSSDLLRSVIKCKLGRSSDGRWRIFSYLSYLTYISLSIRMGRSF